MVKRRLFYKSMTYDAGDGYPQGIGNQVIERKRAVGQEILQNFNE